MAKQTLPTNYKDDVLATSMGKKRRYNLIQNDDGTISLEDVTEYTQEGDNYGAAQLNATNQAVNESVDQAKIIDSLDDIAANTQAGMVAGALAIAELNGNMACIKHKKYTVTKNFVKGTNSAVTIDIPWNKIVSIHGTLRYGANLHALPTSPVGGSGTYNDGMLAQLVITSSNVIQLWLTTAWNNTTLSVVVGYTD